MNENWKKIDFKGKNSGQIKTQCPVCSKERSKKNDPPLSVNIDNGVAKCHHCNIVILRNNKYKNYDTPNQDWKSKSTLSEEMLKWFLGRGIGEKTLAECRITEERFYQPSLGEEVNNIVFNYFEEDVLVKKKYRSGDKRFAQTKNSKKTFYGIDDIIDDKGKVIEDVVIVEGEMDKLAFWEAGIRNVISVPNGANDVDDVLGQYRDLFAGVKLFYISVHNDEAGQKLEAELARRLGKSRCRKVVYPQGCKDANDVIMNHDPIELEVCLQQAEFYPVTGVQTIESLRNPIMDYWENGEDTGLPVKNETFNDFNKIFRFVNNQFTIWTGYPGSGKSTFLETYLLNLMIENEDLKCAVFSPEHYPLQKHFGIVSQRITGKPFDKKSMTKEEIDTVMEWSDKQLFMINPDGDGDGVVDWDWMIEKWKEMVFRFGVNVILVDAFNKVFMKDDGTSEINKVLNKITHFKRQYDVHIHLVAHTKKPFIPDGGHAKMPNPYDIAGSAHFYNQADNIIMVHRDEDNLTQVRTGKIKFSAYGRDRSQIQLCFDRELGRYHRLDQEVQTFNLLTKEESSPKFGKIEPNFNFNKVKDV